MTDEQLDRLAVKFGGGDEKAFNEIKAHFEPEIYESVFSLIKNETEAKNIISKTFQFIWNMEDKFNTITNIKWCLYYNTRNKSLAYLKSQRKK